MSQIQVSPTHARPWSIHSIRSRLALGIFLLVILASALFFLMYGFLNNQAQFEQKLSRLYQPINLYAQQISTGLYENSSTLKREFYRDNLQILETSKATRYKINEIWKYQIFSGIDTLEHFIAQLQRKEIRNRGIDLRNILRQIHQGSQKSLERVRIKNIQTLQAKTNPLEAPGDLTYSNPSLQEHVQNQLLPLQESAQIVLDEIVAKIDVIRANEQSAQAFQRQRIVGWAIALIIAFLLTSLWLYWSLSSYLKQNIDTLQSSLNTLLEGEIPQRMGMRTLEFSGVIQSLNAFYRRLANLKEYSKKVSQNQFVKDMDILPKEGSLGQALDQMQNGLSKISEANEIRNWTNTGMLKFSELVTRYSDNLESLAQQVINNLVLYLDINQGGFFVVENLGGEGEKLRLSASYAYNREKFIEKEIALGQGIIGQVWLEKKTQYMEDIPENYVTITSGLGEATPRALLIVPLVSSQHIHGILELGSFEKIPEYKIAFVKEIAETVGQSIAALQINQQTRTLLSESQELTRTLRNQEEVMRQNYLELETTQKQMRSTQKELAEKEANLDALINNTSHAIVGIDQNYQITVVNRAMRQLYLESGVRLDVGSHLKHELSPEETLVSRDEFERVLDGERIEILREVEKYGNTLYYNLHYNPIRDEEKHVIGASVFVENITDQKLANMQLKEAEANLTSLINDTEDAIMALDQNFRIIVVNEVYKKEFEKRGVSLQIGETIFDYMTTREMKRWKALYDRALNGEHFSKVIDSGKFPNKTYREHWFNPIRDEMDKITGFSIFSRDITESKKSEIKIRQLLLDSLEATESLKAKEEEMMKKIKNYEERIRDLESGMFSSN